MARAAHPELIFLDVMMPKMDGFQACKLLKDDPDLRIIPIIMVTGKKSARMVLSASPLKPMI